MDETKITSLKLTVTGEEKGAKTNKEIIDQLNGYLEGEGAADIKVNIPDVEGLSVGDFVIENNKYGGNLDSPVTEGEHFIMPAIVSSINITLPTLTPAVTGAELYFGEVGSRQKYNTWPNSTEIKYLIYNTEFSITNTLLSVTGLSTFKSHKYYDFPATVESSNYTSDGFEVTSPAGATKITPDLKIATK